MVDVAQLVRASVCGTEGRGFKTPHSPFEKGSIMDLSEAIDNTYPATITIVDVESTCWKDAKDQGKEISEIIELGVANIVNGKIKKEEPIFIKPQHSEVSPFCTQLTTITPELIEKKGLSPKEAFEKLAKVLNKNVWGSYGFYDLKQIKKMIDLYKIDFKLPLKHINVKELYSKLVMKSKDPYAAGGMGKVLKALGLKLEGTHHRGADDAYNIARIYLKLIKNKQV